MTIKKVYVELIAFLESNENKKVKTILDDIKAMCEGKNKGGSEIGKTFVKDDEGVTQAIFCWYFKKWMSVEDIEFGRKANTASGYNTMCKEGVRNWTKQQREAKVAESDLLEQVVDGNITIEDLPTLRAEIEANRKRIVEAEEPLLMFDTYEDFLARVEVEEVEEESITTNFDDILADEVDEMDFDNLENEMS